MNPTKSCRVRLVGPVTTTLSWGLIAGFIFFAGCRKDPAQPNVPPDIETTPSEDPDEPASGQPKQPPSDPADGDPKDDPSDPNAGASTTEDYDVVYLDQGWSNDERQAFYYSSQGSQLIPYGWFLNVEQADSQESFRDDANLKRLGFLTQRNSDRNPDGLPIGFVKDDDPDTVAISYEMKKAFLGPDYEIENYPNTNSWLGLTCAACHTNDLHFGGKIVRIDGGAAMIDAQNFQRQLAAALRATGDDEEKFTRFAKRVLGDSYNAGEAAALKSRLTAYTGALEQWVERNKSDHPYGFARLDAFGAILNQVCETALQIPENHGPSNAPVSYPFLWDTPHLDWVQWNGSVSDPIERNVGEVLGVFAHFKLDGTPQTGQFTSTANIQNLDRLEQLVETLSSPIWPEEVLGEIDTDKAKLGEQLYADNCAKCHHVRDSEGSFPMTAPNKYGKQFIRTVMVPVFPPDKDKIGTDPKMVVNVVTRLADPGSLRPLLPESMRQAPKVPAGVLLHVAALGVINRQLTGVQLDEEQQATLHGFRDPDAKPPNPAAYKARPLNGIWATAPYLHNGSVPNLYQLLLPETQRVTSFRVGSLDFDPVNVGYQSGSDAGGFVFATKTAAGDSIPGNSNLGHSGKFYTQTKDQDGAFRDFTDDERWALVEYMKTLR